MCARLLVLATLSLLPLWLPAPAARGAVPAPATLAVLLPAAGSLAVVAPVLVAPGPAPFFGPPGLCHPLDIGEAPSLPFGAGAFEVDPAFDRATTVPATTALLEQGSGALVDMETLRRAVVYLTHAEDGGSRLDEGTHVELFVAALEVDLERARAEAAGADGTGAVAGTGVPDPVLAAFHLGYALGLLGEAGHRPRGAHRARELVEQVVAARPEDGALRLGAAIVAFSEGRRERSYEHLAVVLADADDALLQRNACKTMGSCLGARDRAELLADVSAALGRA